MRLFCGGGVCSSPVDTAGSGAVRVPLVPLDSGDGVVCSSRGSRSGGKKCCVVMSGGSRDPPKKSIVDVLFLRVATLSCSCVHAGGRSCPGSQ